MRFPRTSPPNSALHTEEGASQELQVVIPDPSCSQARGQAQAAESRKPRRPQKSRIREIDEAAAFHTRTPLNARKPPTQTPNQSDASRTPQGPARQYPGSRRETWNFPPASPALLLGIEAPASPAHRPHFRQGFVFRGVVVLPGPLCQVPTLNPPGTCEISAHLLPNPALHTGEGAGPELQVVTPDPSSGQARGQAQAAESRKPRRPQKSRIREIDETAAFHIRTPLNARKPPTQTPNQSDASRTPQGPARQYPGSRRET